MASRRIGEVRLDVKANAENAVSGLKRTERSVRDVGDATKRAGDAANSGRSGFAGLFSSIRSGGSGLRNITGLLAGAGGLTVALGAVAGAAAAAIKGIQAFSLGLTEAQNDLDSNASIVNATLGEYRSLEIILGSVGIAGERTRDFLHAINRSVSQGKLGLGEYTRAFEILGVSAEEFGSFGAQERVFALLEAIRELSQEDAAFVVSTIGQRAGREILALRNADVDALRARAEGIEELVDGQEKLRLAASGANAEYKIAAGELRTAFEGSLLPLATGFVNALTASLDVISAMRDSLVNTPLEHADHQIELLEYLVELIGDGSDRSEAFQRNFNEVADAVERAVRNGKELTTDQLNTLEKANQLYGRETRLIVESVRRVRDELATQALDIPVDFELPPTPETQAKLDAEAAKLALQVTQKLQYQLETNPEAFNRFSIGGGPAGEAVRRRYEEEQRKADELGLQIVREQQDLFRAREEHQRRVDRILAREARVIAEGQEKLYAEYERQVEQREAAEAQLQSNRLAATTLWGSAISTVLNNAVSGTREWGDVILDILGNIVQAGLTSPTGFGGLFGGLFGGGRAYGGPVSGGTTYLVGERGPELFTPNVSGSIIPNPGGVTVNSTINVSAGVSRVEFESAIDARDANLVDTITRLASTPGSPLSTAVRVANG